VRVPFRLAVSGALVALLVSIASFLTPVCALPAAHAATWTVDTSARTEAEVRAMWNVLKPVYSGTPYATTPSWGAPYAPGELTNGFRADGINMINFGRYLAGLPYDVTLNGTRDTNGQYGAVLLRRLGYLVHTPAPEERPVDMTVAFFDTAKAATGSSNIGSGDTTSYSFQKGCLDDASASNLATVGHRRWLLNPPMLYSGIGFADNYHTTYAFDRSRTQEVDYDVIAWPSAGVFPVEFANRLTPWSITLNPDKYDWDAKQSGHTVTLRRVKDGKTWTFDDADSNTAGEYFNADFSYMGLGNAFIFRPNPADFPSGYLAGEQYDVTLSGGIYAEGTQTPVTVTYRTSFGTTLDGATTTFAADTATPDQPVVPEPTTRMPVFRFYNKANGSHFYTASAVECGTVIAKYGATYTYEGIAYQVDTANPANCAPLYRFYNLANGSHFYTASVAECDSVRATLSATYAYEGPAYNVAATGAGTTPMYRFYNRANGSHFYTASAAERDRVSTQLAATYSYDGVSFYIAQ
jgi:hypothetical protein